MLRRRDPLAGHTSLGVVELKITNPFILVTRDICPSVRPCTAINPVIFAYASVTSHSRAPYGLFPG